MGERLLAYLRLMRPANIITAFADILAGVAIAFSLQSPEAGIEVLSQHTNGILLLLLSTLGLYGGGVVFNDVFDLKLDTVERPERPLPSGKVPLVGAIFLGVVLLLIGFLAAIWVNRFSGLIALVIIMLVLLYNSWAKHYTVFGPIIMGSCRAGNLLLGVSLIPTMVIEHGYVGLIPLLYIGAITLVSQGEVHGGNKTSLRLAGAMYLLVMLLMVWIGQWNEKDVGYGLPFLALLAFLIIPPLRHAIKSLQPKDIMKAVKAGVLALIVLDSTIAAIFGGIGWGLCILLLLPISRFLAKLFAVT